MEILGTHKVSFAAVRALAIQYHALDLSAHHLLLDGTHMDSSRKTKTVYEELFTGQLLALAIAIRTKFYQGLSHKETEKYVFHCGFLCKYENGKETPIRFSIKDICDKIIHAESVNRLLENGVEQPITILKSKGQRGEDWECSMSGSLFAEGVLNWIEDTENGMNE